jgi:hypothetical protein
MVRVIDFSNKKSTDRSAAPKRLCWRWNSILFVLATIGIFQYAFLLSVYLSSALPLPTRSQLERRIVKSAPRSNSPLGYDGSCMNHTIEECSGNCKWCKDKCEQLSNECTPNTIYAHLIGGLANKLWIFISIQGIARKTGSRLVYLDGRDFRLIDDIFALDYTRFALVNGSDITSRRSEVHGYPTSGYSPIKKIKRNTRINGFLQNPRYFAANADYFATTLDLEFQPSVVTEATDLMRELGSCRDQSNNEEMVVVKKWVGLHVRRFPDRHTIEPGPEADAMERQVNEVLQQCEDSLSSNEMIRGKSDHQCSKDPSRGGGSLSTCCAMIFSNDPSWAKENLKLIRCAQFVENEILEDPELPGRSERNNAWATHQGRDLAAMTMCHYLILTVGTYGYFGGILHDHPSAVQRRREEHGSANHVYIFNSSIAVKYEHVPSAWQVWV